MVAHIPISYFSSRSIGTINETLAGTTTSGQSGPGSNGNEVVTLHSQYSNPNTECSFVSKLGHIIIAQSAVAVEYIDCFSPNECPGYDTKQSDGETPVMWELWEMQSTPSLPLLPAPLWAGIVAPDRTLSMDSIELAAYLC